jgi:ABC-2 type transport system ATP-binding protein
MKRRLNLAAGLLHDPDVLAARRADRRRRSASRNAIFDNLEELKRRGKALRTRRTTWKKPSASPIASW